MIATLPDSWLALIPPPGLDAERTPVAYDGDADLPTLRQRIADLAAGKRGDEWGVIRRLALGERLFRIEGGPGSSDLPLVVGVDEFLSKRVIWTLAAELPTAPPDAISAIFAPSLSILRDDVAGLGGASSRWTEEHVREKWIRASEKIETENAGARAFTDRLLASTAEGAEKRATSLPLVAQFDDRYFVLDDRAEDRARYEGPMKGVALRSMARALWGESRVLDQTTAKGAARPMSPAEIVDAYGVAISTIATEYSALAPRVDGLTLTLPPPVGDIPEPQEDRDVAAWLEILDPSGGVLDWIAYARRDRLTSTAPALALIGGAQVGKSLLADAVARTFGARRATPLRRVLGQFAAMLAACPVLFADEGIPRDPRTGVPLTEEFRALVTSMDHVIEAKGTDRSVYVRGGVRVVLAANRLDRLFASRGAYGAHDIAALARRLFVVEITDPGRVEAARSVSVGLGSFEGDPVRLGRVARHLSWIQRERDAKPPTPRAALVERELRIGSDVAREALDALEDSYPVPWIALDGATVWVQVTPWVQRTTAGSLAPLARALGAYITHPSEKRRTHPTTKVPDPSRSRWIGLDRIRLAADGVNLE